jgi:hypothetical protein
MNELKDIDWLKWILAIMVGLFILTGIINAIQNLF